jgi:uncharacterized alkaline shock family protein YloU
MDGAWEERPTGTTTIAPGVLVTIARLTALGVPGVTNMAPVAGGVNSLFRRGAGEGVRIEVSDNTVSVDLYLVLAPSTNVRDVGRKVQAEVASAIENMVDMPVARVDVHIEDFDDPPAAE